MTLQFLLVPDSSAARSVRRELVQTGGYTGVVVGTWPELVEQARNAYLLPARDGGEAKFHAASSEVKDAFWKESFSVSPQETATAIEEGLYDIISASDHRSDLVLDNSDRLPERPKKHFEDLVRLAETLGKDLPGDLSTVKELIAANAADALQTFCVHCICDVPVLTRWQSALIEKLNNDSGGTPDEQLTAVLKKVHLPADLTGGACSLSTLQAGLFLPPDEKQELDGSIQWVGTRDFLEEAEVSAGMVQIMLDEHADLVPSDIGLLLPDSFTYSVAVDDAFSQAGIVVSGLPVERWQRDLGREAVFHFLYCRQKPAPAMALAVCLSSPLMPWSREEGALLAQSIMDGDYALRPFGGADVSARSMLDLVRDGDEEPKTLIQALQLFVSLLDGGDEFIGHVQQARSTVEDLSTLLESAGEIDWATCRQVSKPKAITTGVAPDFNLEGVTVWREGHEPWRPVRKLIVLGFAAGNYPVSSRTSSVFSADDLKAIRDHLDLNVSTPADELANRRARFKRQLAATSEFVTFLIPRRDPVGGTLAPSESLVFMQRMFDGGDDLVLELDSAVDRKNVRYLALADVAEPGALRQIALGDIQFERDLLSLRKDREGKTKPESPSSLETLMVSPLAWLLRRLNAEPLGWAPESPNVMLLGTLAHQVFEGLFQSGKPLPQMPEISARVVGLLDDAIRQHAPFLRAAQWQVERRHLAAGITKAASVWADILEALGARILGSEEWLKGKLGSVAIHGQVDLLLGLSGDRLLIVDYKRSSSNARRPRMQKGYDSQASLYRTMLQTGGAKDEENTNLTGYLSGADQAGIVYFMLNDQTALADLLLKESAEVPGWEAMEGDVASHAIALIEKRLGDVQIGLLSLNREGDAEFFDKTAGVKPYALSNSPLLPLLTMPGETEVAE